MAQLTSAKRIAGLRARPGFSERIDLPQRVVFVAAASMIGFYCTGCHPLGFDPK